MTILDEYHNYFIKYKHKYGEKTIALMVVGMFYEAYGVNTEKEKYGCDNIYEIGNLLNLIVTRRNKSIIEVSKSNHLMVGFPINSLKKYIDVLIENGYTIILIEQYNEAPNIERRVSKIISPSTYIEEINKYEENFLMVMYISENFDYKIKNTYINVAIGIFDLLTGKTYLYETPNNLNDSNLVLDEIYRIKQIYNPKELVIFGELNDKNFNYEKIYTYLELDLLCVHNKLNKYEKKILKLPYQNEILKKIYKNTGFLSPIEYINLEKNPNLVIVLIFMIEFLYDHNSDNIKNFSIPEIYSNNEKLIIEFNTIKKLNIISDNNNSKTSSLLNILNNCISANGKRYFKNALLNPITNINELKNRYYNIELFLKNDLYNLIRNELKEIIDFERSYNKLIFKTFHPCEFQSLLNSFQKVLILIQILEDNNITYNCNKTTIESFIFNLQNTFNFDELLKFNLDNISENFFKLGFNKEIDEIQEELNKYNKYFTKLIHKLNGLNPDFSGFFKVEYTERDGFYISITSKRFLLVKKKINLNTDISIYDFKNTFKDLEDKMTPNKLNIKITSKNISHINDKIFEIKNDLKKKITSTYFEICNLIYDSKSEIFKEVIDFVNKIDFYSNNAFNAIKFNHNKPTIDEAATKSFVSIEDIRNPIIEAINTEIPYITNDIKLGTEGNNGILIYGCNSVGKSSLLKAIALNIIQAQSGLYVASKTFNYFPYTSIFTRFPSSDDIFKGKSTFIVEINEILTIIKKANANSIVLADELLQSTETTSALSLITASIMELSKKQTSFLIASHLHELKNIEEIQKINTLKIYHLQVSYDKKTNDLIFDRKLKQGGGPENYGLEIASSFDFSKEFLKNAELIKKKLLNENIQILNNKTSHFNAKKFVDCCSICGCKEELEVHHIRFQKDADKYGNIDNKFHKNVKFNLTILCDECHNKIHSNNNNIVINGYIATNKGIKLDYNIENIVDICEKTSNFTKN
jgi:DNA mismatch repair protein MutS